MARVLHLGGATGLDRREGSRNELCLGVTLRGAGEQDIIPAEITNLSATGFLAELPQGFAIPSVLEVQLPHAGVRMAQVVWTNGSVLGCSFSRPLSKPEVSAAYLKSEPRQVQADAAKASSVSKMDPSDPIWDVAAEAKSSEKWSLRTRVLVIASVATVPWITIAGLVTLFA